MSNSRRTFNLPGHGLRCEKCDSSLPRVHRTVTTDGFVTRERICPECGALNITAERVIHARDRRKYFSD